MAHYKRQHHNLIDQVLRSLNSELLAIHECYFAGGTAIALKYDEFRESVDIDFLVSNPECYGKLRNLLFGKGLSPIVETGYVLQHTEVRSDRYGIRTSVLLENTQIKFEIVPIDLLKLDRPKASDAISSVMSITDTDMIATKMIANAFRGSDKAYYNRDLLDIVFMNPVAKLLQNGRDKALDAQGDIVLNNFKNEADKLLADKAWLEICLHKLDINTNIAVCQAMIKQIVRKFDI